MVTNEKLKMTDCLRELIMVNKIKYITIIIYCNVVHNHLHNDLIFVFLKKEIELSI